MKEWSIEYCERPLQPSWVRDFFRKGTGSHGFLRVRNDRGEDVLELHGLFSSKIGAVFNTAARFLLGWPLHLSRLTVVALTNPRLMNVYTAHLPVTSKLAVTGSEDTILRYTDAMVRAGDVINRKGFDYYVNFHGADARADGHVDPGLNCKTVATELLRPFVEPLRNRDGHYENPTRRDDLATVDPVLAQTQVDWASPLEAIRFHIAVGVRELSPKHGPRHWLNNEPLKAKFWGTFAWLKAPQRQFTKTSQMALSPGL